MEHKKDLGKLFKDRLAQVEAEPHTDLWENIAQTLDAKRRKKRGFFLLWSGIVTIIGILLIGYYTVDHSQDHDQSTEITVPTKLEQSNSTEDEKRSTTIIENKVKEDDNGKNPEGENSEQARSEPSIVTEPKEPQNTSGQQNGRIGIRVPTNENIRTSPKNQSGLESEHTTRKKKPLVQNDGPKANAANDNGAPLEKKVEAENAKPQDGKPRSAEEVVQKDSTVQTSKNSRKPKPQKAEEIKKILPQASKKMMVSFQVGPSYYDFIARGNPFESDSIGGQLAGGLSSSYGGVLNIPINEKVTFRIGYRRLNTRFTIKDAISETGTNGNAPIFTSNAIARNGNSIPDDLLMSINGGDPFSIEQKSAYSEIPMEIAYSLGGKKLKFDAIGGFSLQLYGKSEIVVSNSAGSVQLGEATYFKKVSFTSNLGLGIRYPLSDSVRFDLEPTLRYQFNAFEKGYTDQKPFILGINTGFTIKF